MEEIIKDIEKAIDSYDKKNQLVDVFFWSNILARIKKQCNK